MTLAEIKVQVSQLSAEDRNELAGYLKLLALRSDPNRPMRLVDRLARMASGAGIDEAGLLARFPHLRSQS